MNVKNVRVTTAFIILFLFFSHNSQEFQITTNKNNQTDPAIYDNIVVWTDDRQGNLDIYGYDLSKNKEFQITSDENSQSNPAIYEDIVVWEDYRNGNADIYGYNLKIHQEFQITSDPQSQEDPAIYGSVVIWKQGKAGEQGIYGYDLLEQVSFQVHKDPNVVGYTTIAIYEDIVVWEEVSPRAASSISGFNLSTMEEMDIIDDSGGKYTPAIHNDIVVWTDTRHGDFDIYGLNLKTNKEFRITTDPHDQGLPAIYNDIVVWIDERHGNFDIYGYNLVTREEFPITTDENDQGFPAVGGDTVVWEEYKNLNADIYGYDLASMFDNDNDGYYPPEDCDDDNSRVHPGAEEVCDQKDNNCNGVIDEGFDTDNDGYTTCQGDCDDDNSQVHPGAEEVCDQKDNNCNGEIDEGFDTDNDGYTTCQGDCNDTNSQIHPGAEEPCDTDYNCDGDITPCTETLKITVNSQKRALEGAKIYVNEFYGGKTDLNGEYSISNVEAGKTYMIRITKEGYTSKEKPIKIEKGTTTYIEFEVEEESGTNIMIFVVVGILIVGGGIAFLVLKSRKPAKLKVKPKKLKEKRKLPEISTCPVCGNKVEKDWVSCPHCGVRLTDDTMDF
ncbi:MAG: MopE-related protein [Candidatus Methanofastidiosia archaeon]|jgi:beta propeller repeat protein